MYGNEGRGRGRFVPVRIGDELNVTIEAVGEKGDGIAKKDGFVLFVPNTQEGQNVRVRITKVLRKVGFAEVVGEGSAEAEAPAEEAPAEEEPAEEPKGDTEDFGEEPEEEKAEEPAEEEKKEE